MPNENSPSEGFEFVVDQSEISTKEWLKNQRREDYEKSKAARREAKVAEKKAKAEDRAAQRRDRDAELLSAIKPASSLDKEAVD